MWIFLEKKQTRFFSISNNYNVVIVFGITDGCLKKQKSITPWFFRVSFPARQPCCKMWHHSKIVRVNEKTRMYIQIELPVNRGELIIEKWIHPDQQGRLLSIDFTRKKAYNFWQQCFSLIPSDVLKIDDTKTRVCKLIPHTRLIINLLTWT